MLVSLHLPKTAGTSFLGALEQYYGAGLLKDYGDTPLHVSSWQGRYSAIKQYSMRTLSGAYLADIDCVHGHFLPLKYLSLRRSGAHYVTWLRDPVERLGSHYYYWQRTAEENNVGPLHQRMMDENWSLERFCLGPELQNIYAKFLWGFGLSRFDFVGITEHYEEDFHAFAVRFLNGESPQPSSLNTNAERDSSQLYIESKKLREAIEKHHAADVTLYRQALQLRERVK